MGRRSGVREGCGGGELLHSWLALGVVVTSAMYVLCFVRGFGVELRGDWMLTGLVVSLAESKRRGEDRKVLYETATNYMVVASVFSIARGKMPCSIESYLAPRFFFCFCFTFLHSFLLKPS